MAGTGAKEVSGFGGVFLHSWRLAFTHPVTGILLSFTSYLPEELRRVIAEMSEMI